MKYLKTVRQTVPVHRFCNTGLKDPFTGPFEIKPVLKRLHIMSTCEKLNNTDITWNVYNPERGSAQGYENGLQQLKNSQTSTFNYSSLFNTELLLRGKAGKLQISTHL